MGWDPASRYRVKHYSQCLVWAKNNGTTSGIGERPLNPRTLCHLQVWSESCGANVGEGRVQEEVQPKSCISAMDYWKPCWSDNVCASLILLFFIYLMFFWKRDSSCPPPLSFFRIMLLLELRVNYFYPLSPSIKILLCIFFRNPVPYVL